MLLIVVLLAIISAISCRRDGNVTCGSTVDLTVDDYNFWNPGYPSQVNTSVSKTSPCSVTVSRGPKPGVICILEVILNDLELAPAENGECKLDQLIVSGGKVLTEEGEGVPMVPQCGTGTLRRHRELLTLDNVLMFL